MREKRLFGTCGIRGSIDSKVTPELAYRLGMSLSTYIGDGEVVLGRDARTSGETIQNAMASGLLAGGSDVLDVGIVPTPTLAFSTDDLGADAGVMITASHNPPTDNGIKFHNPNGLEYLPEQELDIEDIYFEESYKRAEWNEIGSLESYPGAIKDYIGLIRDSVEVDPGFKVVVDCASGASSLTTPYILRELGCEVVTLNSSLDGRFPAHSPEPQPWNLEDLQNLLEVTDADVGFAHDGDGDRAVAFDEKGNFIKHDTLIALFAKRAVEREGKGTVATSVNTSSSIDEVVESRGGELIRVSLGDLPKASEDHDLVYAGEPGKSIFLDYGRWIDGSLAVAKVLELMSSESKPLSEIASEVPSHPIYRENFPCPDEKKESFMQNARDFILDEADEIREIIDIDGIRIDFEGGGWLLIRTSGTEPKVRTVMEGKTEKELAELKELAHRTVEKFLDVGP